MTSGASTVSTRRSSPTRPSAAPAAGFLFTSIATALATRSTALLESCWWPKSTTPPSTGPPRSTWIRIPGPMGAPRSYPQYSTEHQGQDVNTKGICPAALGTKDEQPAAYAQDTALIYVRADQVCMQ